MAEREPEFRLDEQALVTRAVNGDRNAFVALVWPHNAGLVKYVRRRRLGQDPEDVIQEAYTKAFENMHTFEYRRDGGFGSWLRTIVDRTMADEVRRRRRRPRLVDLRGESHRADGTAERLARPLEDMCASNQRTPSSEVGLNELPDVVSAALAALPPRQQEAIRLVNVEELSHEAAAQRMGTTERAVNSLVSRGKDKLRREELGPRSDYLNPRK
jgi:RNA polymerase sigma-70 factor (ECF subfamily)